VVRDLSAKRRLYEFGRLTLDYVAAGDQSATTLLEDADRRLIELTGGHVTGRVQSLKESTAIS
jgi:replicative DNA helicase